MTMQIYNSLAREKQSFQPLTPGQVRMYVCGMTVYDYCHLGHARVMVVFDMVYRWLKASGYDVTYVRNVTDIDDKVLRKAAESGEEWFALTYRNERLTTEALDALGAHREQRAVARLADVDGECLHHVPRLELHGGDLVLADFGDGALELVVLADELGHEGIDRALIEIIRR